MKWAAIVLSMIVLILTTVPCCALQQNEAEAHYNEQTGTKHTCTENRDCCKDCSPFFTCGTCAGFTLTNSETFIFIAAVKPVQHNSFYIQNEPREIASSIWQPPKLS